MTTTTTTGVGGTSGASSTTAGASPATTSPQDASDRFLKLLVTQMQNQDPLNPMDNAQVTSQMAQINTVTGIDKLNQSVQSLSSQFVQMQALQGAALVGRTVLVEGNSLTVAKGTSSAGFDLSGKADKVDVQVLSPSGEVVDTVHMGALDEGRHGFEWTPPAGTSDGASFTFKVVATSGAASIPATPLVAQQVGAVNTSGDTLTLELTDGTTIPYSQIKAFA
ncbi:MAG TPA: flagellar hook capping FlgD N-terminal domain-containing protein [Burkholderiaceae bacterium]|jgi:flagellar basal-body rod modification protein FlgD|nr:flagellar hook capping FlgD N-terminal domain-containing protein [Burkholderiaceae bacterium]